MAGGGLQASPITQPQRAKIWKALAYSFGSGFVGGLMLSLAGVLQSGGALGSKVYVALIIAGVVGGLNALAVTVRQVFTPPEA